MPDQALTQDYLLEYFKQSETPKQEWKLGLEQEVMGFDIKTKKRINYETGTKKILEELAKRYDWKPYYEGENIVALKKSGSSVTMEPGGQLELSCHPIQGLKENEEWMQEYRSQLHEISQEMDIEWYSIGYDPVSDVQDIPFVPKERYHIMGEYLPQFGFGAHHMMKTTCTAQTNLDYSSEQDMILKMRAAVAISPMVGILFASSPFRLKGLSGFKNTRNWTWRSLDPARTGFLDFVLDTDFGYERYVEYALSVPMLVIERENGIVDMRGESFSSFMKNGEGKYQATRQDWQTQLGCTFPVARLRNAIETRTSDANRFDLIMGQAAFWKGLLYDQESLEKVNDLIALKGSAYFKKMHIKSYLEGFECLVRQPGRLEVLGQVVQLASSGLERLDQENNTAEAAYIKPVQEIYDRREAVSDQLINSFMNSTDRDVFASMKNNNLQFA